MVKINSDFIEKNIYAKIDYENENVVDIAWECPGIGFGHLILDAKTREIIDDEFMPIEFCRIVLNKVYGELPK